MKRKNGRSNAQSLLREKIENAFPTAYVDEEVYIGDLIQERGYSVKELSDEIGHKVPRMFVDIVMRDSLRIVAFEYHGEQHYAKIGNMTPNDAALMLNQKLDQEKAQILLRIGIPLVSIPFDAYVDSSVLDDLVVKASKEVGVFYRELIECPECGRFFPEYALSANGTCEKCNAIRLQQIREYRIDSAQETSKMPHRSSINRKRKEESKEERDKRLQEARDKRKAAYRQWKESDEYQAMKQRQRESRKAARLAAKRKKNETDEYRE